MRVCRCNLIVVFARGRCWCALRQRAFACWLCCNWEVVLDGVAAGENVATVGDHVGKVLTCAFMQGLSALESNVHHFVCILSLCVF
jgi:hypothetical protein